MITAHGGATVWCIVQTALLAGLGLAAMWLLARRAAASAALVGLVAACMILLATLLIPVAIPALLPAAGSGASPVHATPANVPDEVADASTEQATGATTASPPSLLDLQTVVETIRSYTRGHAVIATTGGVALTKVVLAVFGIGALVGLGRLALAIALVAKLRRLSTPILDPATLRPFDELRALLAVDVAVALCESNDIASPALVGWRRPMILLPTERTSWTDDHLRATLAHELAHVVRGDFISRAASQLALAIHFSQPLVHWLARRVTLMQELATDRLAAEAVGGRRMYSRALSELAFRLDDHSRLRLEPVVLPAISSHLTRRMAMLRSQDGTNASLWHRNAARIAVTSLMFVGLGTLALRGETGVPAGEAGGRVSTEASHSSGEVAESSVGFMELASSTMAIVVRPRELDQSQSFTPYAAVAQAFLQDQFELGSKPSQEMPRVRFDAIDYIVCSLRDRRSATDLTAKPSLAAIAWMDVTFELAIRFATPTDCGAWAADNLPGAVRAETNGLAYVQINVGDSPEEVLYLIQRDPFTAVATSDIDRLGQLMENAGESQMATVESETFDRNAIACTYDLTTLTPSDWETFSHFDFAALFVPRAGSYSTSEQPDPMAASKQAFVDGARRMTVGIGVAPDSDTITWSVLLDCTDQQTAASVCKSVEFFQGVAISIVDAFDINMTAAIQQGQASEAEARASAEAMTFTSRLLSEATISQCAIRSTNDSLSLKSTGRIPGLLTMMLGLEDGKILTPVYTSGDEAAAAEEATP